MARIFTNETDAINYGRRSLPCAPNIGRYYFWLFLAACLGAPMMSCPITERGREWKMLGWFCWLRLRMAKTKKLKKNQMRMGTVRGWDGSHSQARRHRVRKLGEEDNGHTSYEVKSNGIKETVESHCSWLMCGVQRWWWCYARIRCYAGIFGGYQCRYTTWYGNEEWALSRHGATEKNNGRIFRTNMYNNYYVLKLIFPVG